MVLSSATARSHPAVLSHELARSWGALLETGAYQVALYLMWVAVDVTEKQLIFSDMQRKPRRGMRRVVGVIPSRIYIVYNIDIAVV
jgi:hypothetical protein